ncbi:6-phosphofructokinase [Clostridium magnum]|uniref:Pyrophosphate--fructose 6-phosphate 1-phosphotransferase n=1 Tax=Clostridium magnum DSM 2767 TaxID=1121326 RepID=A0A162QUR4_9CLOT|nr:6-phosphofructokinase [Clostridium magnum]KZL88994.1 pyrophosphate--fructose 6-phosphate 1-phosphotransferase [Clostridium magnum DSM 2767]SHI23427.1 6-phosphofructokinase 1 [Clostridium magnum DSM 2767]
MNNILVAQSGGPTVAINSTLTGIIEAAQVSSKIDKIYGAVNGIQGIFEEKFIELEELVKNTDDTELLGYTPAAALGSCRFKLNDWRENDHQFKKITDVFRKYNITYFVLIGGNDSMDTVWKLSEYFAEKGIEDIKVIGAPKTIDNDLEETDHCPGFGSAAKYIATTFAELERDISVYDDPAVTIVEVMGRNAGWLTAASALSRLNGGTGPSLIYLCETAFDVEQFIEAVKEKLLVNNAILVAISEGIMDKKGVYISEMVQSDFQDNFGHKYIAGAGRVLENLVREKIGCKVRSIELNLMQRSAGHIASQVDLNEAKMTGRKAVQCLLEGVTGEFISIVRKCSEPYTIEYKSVPISKVANKEKKVPANFITASGMNITDEMLQYLKPLIQGEVNIKYENGIPKHLVLY